MTTRRRFFLSLATILVTPVMKARAATMARVGVLGVGAAGPSSPLVDALRQGLRERGYIEGHNLVVEDRSRVDVYSRLPDIAAELVGLKVDVIVAYGATATQAARKATATTPIVMIVGGDPVEEGFAATLGRPGGTITGLTTITAELTVKHLELLKEAIPSLVRVAVLWNPESLKERDSLRNAETAARSLGLQPHPIEVRRPDDLEKAFVSIIAAHAQALATVPSTMLRAHGARVAALAGRHRLPSISNTREYPEAGGLMSYGSNLPAVFRRAAAYVDRILKGARPADLPIEQPTTLELVINLGTARALGLTIPQSVLVRADTVID